MKKIFVFTALFLVLGVGCKFNSKEIQNTAAESAAVKEEAAAMPASEEQKIKIPEQYKTVEQKVEGMKILTEYINLTTSVLSADTDKYYGALAGALSAVTKKKYDEALKATETISGELNKLLNEKVKKIELIAGFDEINTAKQELEAMLESQKLAIEAYRKGFESAKAGKEKEAQEYYDGARKYNNEGDQHYAAYVGADTAVSKRSKDYFGQ